MYKKHFKYFPGAFKLTIYILQFRLIEVNEIKIYIFIVHNICLFISVKTVYDPGTNNLLVVSRVITE